MSQLPPLDKNQLPPLPANFPQIPQLPKNSSLDEFGKKIARQKKIIGFGVLLFGLGFLGMFIYQLGIVPKLAPQDKTVIINGNADQLLAEVSGQKIYRSDIEKLILQEDKTKQLTEKTINVTLDREIERKILDSEAVRLNIGVSEEEINTSVIKNQATASAMTKAFDDYVFYKLLKEKIIAENTKSVKAYVIGYWVPPSDYPQEAIYSKQRSDGQKAMAEAANRLKNNDTPVAVTEYLYNKYASLKPILGLNGYTYGEILSSEAFLQPKLFVLNKQELDKLNDPEFYELLTSMQPNEIEIVNRKDQSGGAVIKLVSINNSGFGSYDEFLAAKKKELVKQ